MIAATGVLVLVAGVAMGGALKPSSGSSVVAPQQPPQAQPLSNGKPQAAAVAQLPVTPQDQPSVMERWTKRRLSEAVAAVSGRATAVRYSDMSPRDREVGDLDGWVVCVQAPDPGADYRGAQVRYGVVRASERCISRDERARLVAARQQKQTPARPATNKPPTAAAQSARPAARPEHRRSLEPVIGKDPCGGLFEATRVSASRVAYTFPGLQTGTLLAPCGPAWVVTDVTPRTVVLDEAYDGARVAIYNGPVTLTVRCVAVPTAHLPKAAAAAEARCPLGEEAAPAPSSSPSYQAPEAPAYEGGSAGGGTNCHFVRGHSRNGRYVRSYTRCN